MTNGFDMFFASIYKSAHSSDLKRMYSVPCEDVDGNLRQQTAEYSSKQTPEKEYK